MKYLKKYEEHEYSKYYKDSQIDEIFDKISKSGIDSLSDIDKKILDNLKKTDDWYLNNTFEHFEEIKRRIEETQDFIKQFPNNTRLKDELKKLLAYKEKVKEISKKFDGIILEKYNDNKLNELIVKHFNEYSDEIIEIIDTYEKDSDAENILQKIAFIIESDGDVEEIEKGGEIVGKYLAVKDVTENTIFFNTETKKFNITSYKNFMDSLEK